MECPRVDMVATVIWMSKCPEPIFTLQAEQVFLTCRLPYSKPSVSSHKYAVCPPSCSIEKGICVRAVLCVEQVYRTDIVMRICTQNRDNHQYDKYLREEGVL